MQSALLELIASLKMQQLQADGLYCVSLFVQEFLGMGDEQVFKEFFLIILAVFDS